MMPTPLRIGRTRRRSCSSRAGAEAQAVGRASIALACASGCDGSSRRSIPPSPNPKCAPQRPARVERRAANGQRTFSMEAGGTRVGRSRGFRAHSRWWHRCVKHEDPRTTDPTGRPVYHSGDLPARGLREPKLRCCNDKSWQPWAGLSRADRQASRGSVVDDALDAGAGQHRYAPIRGLDIGLDPIQIVVPQPEGEVFGNALEPRRVARCS